MRTATSSCLHRFGSLSSRCQACVSSSVSHLSGPQSTVFWWLVMLKIHFPLLGHLSVCFLYSNHSPINFLKGHTMYINRITTVPIKVLKMLLENKKKITSFYETSQVADKIPQISRSSQSPKLPHEWLHGVPMKAQDTACHSCTKSLINELYHLSPPYPKFVPLWQVKEAGAIDKKAGQS